MFARVSSSSPIFSPSHHVQEFIHARQRFLIETGLQPIGKSLIELFDGSTGFGSNFYTVASVSLLSSTRFAYSGRGRWWW
jgi:hypothetical protein